MQTLRLTIKRRWFDMVAHGEKTEEYREIKQYYEHRLLPLFGERFAVILRNGYRENAPTITATATVRVGEGRQEWGAEKGKKYYILTLNDVKVSRVV